MKQKKDFKYFVKRFFTLYLPLIVILLFLLFPFYWTLVTSLKSSDEIFGAITYWPKNLTLDSYRKLFTSFDFLKYMKSSFIVAGGTTLVALLVSTLAAYSFSRFEFKGKKVLMTLMLTNNMFPTALLLIPLYTIMRSLGLLYSPLSLVVAYTTFTIPFSVWLLIGYMNDVPKDMEEAALIDGATKLKAFIKVVLPTLLPAIIATGVYVFMTAWNEYTFAVMFTNESSRTIPVALKGLVGQLGVEWDLITAGGIITVIPIIIMFFFVQKRLVEGLTSGAVKG